MSMIKVNINKEVHNLDKGVLLKDVVLKHYSGDIPVICCKVNNELCSLDKRLTKDCDVSFLTYLDPIGNRIYQKGLFFLLVYAFKELFGYNNVVKLCHPIDKGVLIRTTCVFDKSNMDKLKDKMLDIVKEDIKFEKCLVTREDAKEYFESINYKNKADVLKYNTTFIK